MEEKKYSWIGRFFRFLSAIVVGGAVGSILGLTLAPKKGRETRQYLRDHSREWYVKSRSLVEKRRVGVLKRIIIRVLMPKKKNKSDPNF